MLESNGCKYWVHNKVLHRIGGPAVEYSNGNKYWYYNNCLHRIDGPAIERSNGDKSWYLYDIHYTETQYNKIMENIPLFCWNRFKGGRWL